MSECKTINFLRGFDEADGDLALVARSAIGIVRSVRKDDIDPLAIAYLRELIDHICNVSGEPLFALSIDRSDCCGICPTLASL